MKRRHTRAVERGKTLGVALVALVILGTVLSPVGLSNAQVTADIASCGVISTPGTYTQTADLTGSGTCIVIARSAGPVTYDGNGFSITGDGTGAGIEVNTRNVDIVNVDVSGFEDGIGFAVDTGGTVSDSSFSSNGVGVDAFEIVSVDVLDSDLTDNLVGVSYGPITGGTVAGNVVENNNAGVSFLDTGRPSDVRQNVFVGNGVGVDVF